MNNNIPVVILCGGAGTRLKEETEFKPKPMVLIGEKPILWHIMKIYAHHGFNRFIIALGYKGEMIKDYFLNQDYFMHDFNLNTATGKTRIFRSKKINSDNFQITFIDTGIETLTGERVMRVKEYIKEDQFMVTYGDGVGNINIRKLYTYHNRMKLTGTITGVHPTIRWGLIRSNRDNLITSFQQKPIYNQYVNGGFMIFNRKFFDYLDEKEWLEDTLAKLVKKRELALYVHDDFWFAMDTYREVNMLNTMWENKPAWKVWKG